MKHNQAQLAFMAAIACIALSGCVLLNEQFIINPNGSGSVHLQVTPLLPQMGAGMMGGDDSKAVFPPMTEGQAKLLFEGMEVETAQKVDDSGKTTLEVTAAFTSINRLLRTEYAKAHGLTVDVQDDRLRVRLRPGLDAMTFEPNDEMAGALAGAGGGDAGKAKPRYQLTITMPAAAAAEGANVDGNSATWTMARDDFDDGEDGDTAFAKSIRRVLAVSAPAGGIKFTPRTPPRINLTPFDALAETAGEEAGAVVDPEKVKAAVEFVPIMIRINRGFDLTGEGWVENNASLMAAWLVPQELVPRSWGKTQVTEAVDDLGNSLIVSDSDDNYGITHFTMNGGVVNRAPDGRQVIADDIQLKPPPGRAKAVARIAGSTTLRYGGSTQIIKLPNAIGAVKSADAAGFSFDEHGGIAHPALKAAGVSISSANAMSNSGITQITLQLDGDAKAIQEVAVFDAAGDPWHVYSQERFMTGAPTYVLIGEPQGPLSLAMLITTGGQGVEVPFKLTDLPINDNSADRGDKKNPEE